MDGRVIESEPIEPQSQEERSGTRKHRGYLVAAVLGLMFLVAAVVGIASRFSERRALADETEALSVTTVAIVHPKAEPPQEELVLPSTLQASTESPIYARTNGYLKNWHKDIGSRVRQGELLADIETPEIDQELLQARATRDQANAQVQIAKTSAKRWETLQKMDADPKFGAGFDKRVLANLKSEEANVRAVVSKVQIGDQLLHRVDARMKRAAARVRLHVRVADLEVLA